MSFLTRKMSPKRLITTLKQTQSITLFRSLSTTTETRTQKLERIADELLDLTKLERYDYSILFRLKMGLNRYGPAVSGPSSAGPVAAGSGAAEAKAAAEKTVFDVKLEKFDAAAKIKIIKEVRTFTDLGLKEAKDMVEKVPVVVKKGVTKEEADSIVQKLKELGATVHTSMPFCQDLFKSKWRVSAKAISIKSLLLQLTINWISGGRS